MSKKDRGIEREKKYEKIQLGRQMGREKEQKVKR